MATVKQKLGAWLQGIRYPFLIMTIIPVCLGALMALSDGNPFRAGEFIALLASGLLLQSGAVLLNDYYDFFIGTDKINREYVSGFTGGSRVIQQGLLSHREVGAAGFALLLLGLVPGIALSAGLGRAALLTWLFALVGLVGYSLVLHTLWVGESLVALFFGMALPAFSYYAQARSLPPRLLVVFLPIVLLVFLVLWISEFPDYVADKICWKRTLVVRLGRRRAMYVYNTAVGAVYLLMALSAIVERSPVFLFVFATVPLAFKSVQCLRQHYDEPERMRICVPLTVSLFLSASLVTVFVYTAKIVPSIVWFITGAGVVLLAAFSPLRQRYLRTRVS